MVRARALSKRIGGDLAIIDKRREAAGVSEVMHVIGEVEGKVCILVDDIIDSGGTLCNAAAALKENGAKEVHAYVVHGVLSGTACDKIMASPMEKLVITNTIAPNDVITGCPKVESLSVAAIIGEAIRRTAEERSISALFK